MLQELLKNGADPTLTMENVGITMHGEERRAISLQANQQTPLDFAVALKRHTSGYLKYHAQDRLGQVAQILLDWSPRLLKEVPSIRVPTSTVGMWEKLLQSGACSDVTFLCSDGVEIPAHKCILSAASEEYFGRAFSGSWRENNPEGRWETAYSSGAMQFVLTFLYTGKCLTEDIEWYAVDLLKMAKQMGLVDLLTVVEGSIIRKLSIDNVVDFLVLSHTHETYRLREACIDFMCSHPVCMVKDGFRSLEEHYPNLWDILKVELSNGRKRSRDDGEDGNEGVP